MSKSRASAHEGIDRRLPANIIATCRCEVSWTGGLSWNRRTTKRHPEPEPCPCSEQGPASAPHIG